MSFQIQLKRHEIFSVNLYLISYQQFLLHEVILINGHLTKICCFAVKYIITNTITLLICPSLGRVEGRVIKYWGWGIILVTVKTTIQKMPPIASCPLCKGKTCNLRSTARRKGKDSKILCQIKPRDPIHSYIEANNCNRQLKSKTKKE